MPQREKPAPQNLGSLGQRPTRPGAPSKQGGRPVLGESLLPKALAPCGLISHGSGASSGRRERDDHLAFFHNRMGQPSVIAHLVCAGAKYAEKSRQLQAFLSSFRYRGPRRAIDMFSWTHSVERCCMSQGRDVGHEPGSLHARISSCPLVCFESAPGQSRIMSSSEHTVHCSMAVIVFMRCRGPRRAIHANCCVLFDTAGRAGPSMSCASVKTRLKRGVSKGSIRQHRSGAGARKMPLW